MVGHLDLEEAQTRHAGSWLLGAAACCCSAPDPGALLSGAGRLAVQSVSAAVATHARELRADPTLRATGGDRSRRVAQMRMTRRDPGSIVRAGVEPIGRGDPGFETTTQVRFLGVMGFVVRRGDEAVMTGPMYSHPSLSMVLAGTIVPDARRIARHHAPERGVKAILVGHAHYDHLMDVPYVWTPEARIYVSSTTQRILAGWAAPSGAGRPVVPPGHVIALDGLVDTRKYVHAGACTAQRLQSGEWVQVPDSRIRLRALAARHPPQAFGIHLWPGCQSEPRATPPAAASDYPAGDVLAYLIDFLDPDDVTPAYRVYYQDSPCDGTSGHVPDELVAERPVDLALLTVGNFDEVEDPEGIIANIRPRHVVLGHWEEFFRDPAARPRALPMHDVDGYRRRLEAEMKKLGGERRVHLPAPGARFRFP